MPKGFLNCVAKKGRVRTVSGPSAKYGLKAGQYVRFCFLGGKSFRGEVRTKKLDAVEAVAERVRKYGIAK